MEYQKLRIDIKYIDKNIKTIWILIYEVIDDTFFEEIDLYQKNQLLSCVVHYLNMKTKGKLVEIIDLQICSTLKLNCVYKKEASWAVPHPV